MYPRTEDDREKRNRRRTKYRTRNAIRHPNADETQSDTNRSNPMRLRWLHTDAVAFSLCGTAGGGVHRDRNSMCLNGIAIRRSRVRTVHLRTQHAAGHTHFWGELCERNGATRTVHYARQSKFFVGVPVDEGRRLLGAMRIGNRYRPSGRLPRLPTRCHVHGDGPRVCQHVRAAVYRVSKHWPVASNSLRRGLFGPFGASSPRPGRTRRSASGHRSCPM
jgi:hypothetical protein